MTSATTTSGTKAKRKRKRGGGEVQTIKGDSRIKTPPGLLDVRELRGRYGLPQVQFSRVLSISTRRLTDLEKGQKPTEAVARRLTEADRLHRALSDVVAPAVIGAWMQQPNEAFGGLKPIELIERGRGDELWRMIYEIGAGDAF